MSNRQATQNALPIRLISGGISVGLIVNIREVAAHPGDLTPGAVVATIIIIGAVYGVCALLAYGAFKQLPAKVGALIGLSVAVGVIVMLDIVGMATSAGSTESSFGFVADIADVVVVIGIIMLWYARSKSAPRQY
jgi:hypothetical protein